MKRPYKSRDIAQRGIKIELVNTTPKLPGASSAPDHSGSASKNNNFQLKISIISAFLLTVMSLGMVSCSSSKHSGGNSQVYHGYQNVNNGYYSR
jgi:hypothetical protein